jgi:hypothetical protein
MDEVELASPDYLDADWIAHNHIPGAGPSDEMLERLCSQPLFQHWRFEEGAPARQAFAYPVMPRTTKECDLVGDVFPGGTCDILIEMADGRIAGFEFDSDTAFQLTGNLIRKLATRLTKRAGLNKKPLPAHLTPYTTKGAWLCCANVLKTAAGTRTEAVIKVRDCTRYAPIFFNITGQLNAIWDELFLFEAYSDPLAQPTGLQLTRLAGVILNGLNDFIHALREYAIQTLTASQFWPTLHNYLTHPDPLIRRNRRQAYELLPLPITHLMSVTTNEQQPWLSQRWNATRRIDAGHSPYAVFSKVYGVSKSTLRDYSLSPGRPEFADWVEWKVINSTGFRIGRPRIPTLFFSLEALSPALRPKTRDEWDSFCDWVQLFSWLSYLSQPDNLTRLVCEISQIGWTRIDDWVAQKYGIEGSSARGYLMDYHSAFDEYFLFDTSTDLVSLHKDLTIRKLLHNSHLWHQAVTQVTGEYLQALQMDGSRGECFEWPLPGEFELIGYRIHAICDSMSLAEEGAAMNHCVSTLMGHCLAGEMRIFSLRDTSNNRCSTFDICFLRDDNVGLSIRLNQHQGHRNSRPKPEWKKVVTAFVNWLKEPAQLALLTEVENLGRNGTQVYSAGEAELIEPALWIRIEAVHRCRTSLGLDQYIRKAPSASALDQTTATDAPLRITLTSTQPVNHLLLKWMAPILPVTGDNLQLDVKTPKETLASPSSELNVIFCDYHHDEPTTVALARSLIDDCRSVMVLMPPGSDVGRIAEHGILAVEGCTDNISPLEDIFITLLSPGMQEGLIGVDWADINALLHEDGIGKFYVERDDNFEKASLKVCERLKKDQQRGRAIKGALLVLPSRAGINEIHQVAAQMFRKIPEEATRLCAATFRETTPYYEIRAFVVYGQKCS